MLLEPTIYYVIRLQSYNHTSKLFESLMNGSVPTVSNGSLFFQTERVGACAWAISSSDGSEWIEGGGIILGPVNEQSSSCSELG